MRERERDKERQGEEEEEEEKIIESSLHQSAQSKKK